MTTTTATAAAAHVSDLAEALADMAHCLGDTMTAGDVGPILSCGEAESVAAVLRAAGHTEAASTWIDGHTSGDEEGDAHFTPQDPCTQCQVCEADEHGMCPSCLHDAYRSGWTPGA